MTRPTTGRSGPDASAGYASAMMLYERGAYRDAADAFRVFVATHPRATQAEDASFLAALSLARAGSRDAVPS